MRLSLNLFYGGIVAPLHTHELISDVQYQILYIYIAYHDYQTPNLSRYNNNRDITTHHLCI